MRINAESFFEHFEGSLRDALSKALEETAPGEARCDADKLYQAFRRYVTIDLTEPNFAQAHLPDDGYAAGAQPQRGHAGRAIHGNFAAAQLGRRSQ